MLKKKQKLKINIKTAKLKTKIEKLKTMS